MSFTDTSTAVTTEFMLGEEWITPGTWLKIKNVYNPVLYQCLVTDMSRDVTYAWCLHAGRWKAFSVKDIKGVVKRKRSFNKCKS